MPLLDLHGLQKSPAIRAVTGFLESHRHQKATVCIVTGSGAHSQQGPILRTAVEELLRKRHMEYQRDTPGSFRVKAGTGITFHHQASTEEDTKIIIQNKQDDDNEMEQFARLHNNKRTRARQKLDNEPLQSDDPPPFLQGPSLREVASHNAVWQRAKEESLQTHRTTRRNQHEEKRRLEQALQESQTLHQQQEETFSENLRQAMEESERSLSQAQEEEDELVEQIMRESAADESNSNEQMEQELQKAVAMSLQQQQDQQHDPLLLLQEEEDRMLREALALSLQHNY